MVKTLQFTVTDLFPVAIPLSSRFRSVRRNFVYFFSLLLFFVQFSSFLGLGIFRGPDKRTNSIFGRTFSLFISLSLFICVCRSWGVLLLLARALWPIDFHFWGRLSAKISKNNNKRELHRNFHLCHFFLFLLLASNFYFIFVSCFDVGCCCIDVVVGCRGNRFTLLFWLFFLFWKTRNSYCVFIFLPLCRFFFFLFLLL